MKKLRIASRTSLLAMHQTNLVARKLLAKYPNLEVEIIKTQTSGDRFLDQSLDKIGGKGLFIKELEVAMQEDRADIAVHSMKDLPYQLPEEFNLCALLPRGNPFDAWVSNQYESLMSLPTNALVGTSSNRRKTSLLALRSDIRVQPLRGNLQTRLAKLDRGEYDAIVLAVAGLERLELTNRISRIFSLKELIPASCQGVIAVEAMKNNEEAQEMLASLHDVDTAQCAEVERAFIQKMQADCHFPVGVYASMKLGLLEAVAFISDLSAKTIIRKTGQIQKGRGKELGFDLAEQVLADGGQKIMDDLRR